MKKSNGPDYELFEVSRENFEKYCQKNLETFKEVIDLGFKYGSLWQEYLSEQMQRLSNAKDLSDVIATESGLATEYTAKFNETGRRLYEIVSESMTEQMKDLQLPSEIENFMPYPASSKKAGSTKSKSAG